MAENVQNAPHEGAQTPTEREKNIFKRFLYWLHENPAEGEYEAEESIEKSADETVLEYTGALAESIQSIHADDTLNNREKVEMLQKSIEQFNDAIEQVHLPPENNEDGDKEPDYEEIDDDYP